MVQRTESFLSSLCLLSVFLFALEKLFQLSHSFDRIRNRLLLLNLLAKVTRTKELDLGRLMIFLLLLLLLDSDGCWWRESILRRSGCF